MALHQVSYNPRTPWVMGFRCDNGEKVEELVKRVAPFTVSKRPLGFILSDDDQANGTGEVQYVDCEFWGEDDVDRPKPSQFGAVRDDNLKTLAGVGQRYEVLQHHEVFDWVAGLMSKYPNLTPSAATLMHGGRELIVQFKLNAPVETGKGDAVQPYLIARNSHGGGALKLYGVVEIPACTNQLRLMEAGAQRRGSYVSISHTAGIRDALSHAEVGLGLVMRQAEAFTQLHEAMSKVQMPSAKMQPFLEAVYPASKTDELGNEVVSSRLQAKRDRVEELFVNGAGAQMFPGSVRNIFQAVVEYENYERGRSQATRYAGLHFGTGDQAIQRGLQYVRRLVS